MVKKQSILAVFTGMVIFVLLLCLTGCSQFAQKTATIPVTQTAPASGKEGAVNVTAAPAMAASPSATATKISETKTIMLWVPPQFDPVLNDQAAISFSKKLNSFMEENPNTKVSVRVKAVTGDSSSINALAAAKSAATEAVPSLIILNRNDLVTAVQKGLIYPISTGIFTESGSWYSYARQSSVVDNLIYGIPIAGDPLVLGYRPSKTGPEINTWSEILSRGLPIAFLPSSTTDLFGTFTYVTQNGKITNDLGQAWLNQATLVETLQVFLTGGQQGAFPPSLTQETDMEHNLQMFLEGSIHMIVTRLTAFKHYAKNDIEAIPLPLEKDNSVYPMVNTWNVVLTNSNPEHQNLAVKLAEKLADPVFNDEWTNAAGFLPVRTTDHTIWAKDTFYDNMLFISKKAELIPNSQILSKIVPVINQAITSVIKASASPEDAAKTAIESLN